LQLRHDALHVSLSKVLDRQDKAKTSTTVKVGDIVIAQLSSHDSTKLLRSLGTSKLAPLWSEPMRVVKTYNNGLTIQAKSVWHDQVTRQFNVNQVQLLPRDCDPSLLPLILEDLKHDRTVHRSSTPSHPSTSTFSLPSRDAAMDQSILRDLLSPPANLTELDLTPPTGETPESVPLGGHIPSTCATPAPDAHPAASSSSIAKKRRLVELNFVLLRETPGPSQGREIELS
jgi:hypothetical protein